MTPKIIELRQAPVVLVELNCYFSNPDTIGIGNDETYTYMRELSTGNCIALGVNLKVLGALSDLTEDQFEECVDRTKTHPKYWNYNLNYFREFRASDSFASLLESEKVYTESQAFPDMYDPKYYDEPYDGTGFYQEIYSSDIVDWQEAQSRTIDPLRIVVLLRKDKN